MARRWVPRDDEGAKTTYDVRIWEPRKVVGKTKTSWECRWKVGAKPRSRSFATRALAVAFLGDLRAALNRGEPFDLTSGMPLSLLPDAAPSISWWEWTLRFVDLKWFDAAPRTRRSTAEALVTATMSMLDTDPEPARSRRLREAMMQWAYNSSRRTAEPDPPEPLAGSVHWLARHSLPLDTLTDLPRARALVEALGKRLDGGKASPTTAARKRAVVHNALEFAVEHGHLGSNPLNKVKRVSPKVPERVDPRVVINPAQAQALLQAVGETDKGARLVAFFALIYYAALRPSEALDLRESDLELPTGSETDGDGWGMIYVGRSNPEVARAWTDTGRREGRQLKHRARGEIRPVPAAPQLVQILRDHLARQNVKGGGRLFIGPRGGHLSEDTYSRIWQHAREAALTQAQAASPLAARPYDLRHAAVSTWLAAGVESTQVAAWAGHSVAVLHRVYAQIISGRTAASKQAVVAALSHC